MTDLSGVSVDDLIKSLSDEDLMAIAGVPPKPQSVSERLRTMPVTPDGDLFPPSTRRGVLAGFSDEVAGGIRGLASLVRGGTFGEGYQTGLASERQAFDAERGADPAGAAVREMAGGGLSAMLMGGVPAAPTLGGQMLRGALAGGEYGALYGFGTGEDGRRQRIENTFGPTAAGVAVGGLAPAAIKGADLTKEWVKNLFRPATQKVQTEALNRLLKAFNDDKITTADALEKIKAWQAAGAKPEALVDLGGKNVQGLVATASRTPGPGKQTISDFVAGRQQGQAARVDADLSKLSANRNYLGTLEELIEERSKAAAPLYEKALDTRSAFWSEPLDKLMSRPSFRRGLAYADLIAREQGHTGMATFFREIPDTRLPSEMGQKVPSQFFQQGEKQYKRIATPDWRSLDYIKQGIDRVVEENVNQFGRLTAYGRAANATRKQLLEILDAVNPDYKIARDAFSGPTQSINALRLGRSALAEDADVAAAEVAKLSAGDKELFRAGLVRAILDKVKSAPDGADAIKRFFGNELNRERIQAAFPSKQAFDLFATNAQREASMFSVNRAINPATGSQTMPLLAQANTAQGAGMALDLATGNNIGAARRAVAWMFGAREAQKLTPEVSQRIADLAKTNPQQALAILSTELNKAGMSRGKINALIALAGRGASGAVAAAAE